MKQKLIALTKDNMKWIIIISTLLDLASLITYFEHHNIYSAIVRVGCLILDAVFVYQYFFAHKLNYHKTTEK